MDKKSLVILEDRRQIDRLVSLAEGQPTLLALNSDVAQELARRGTVFKTPEDYGLSGDEIEGEGLKWLRTFPEIKIKDNKNIKELITYDGLSVWWWLEEPLYYSHFVFTSVRELVMQAIVLNRIIKAEEPALICYAEGNTAASRVTELICDSQNITRTTVAASSGTGWQLPRPLKTVIFIYGQWLRILLREIYWALLSLRYRSRKPAAKRKVLIFSGPSWGNVHDHTTGETGQDDPYFHSVIELLKDENEIVLVDIPTTDWGLSTMKAKRQQKKILCKPLEYYLNTGVLLKALRASKNLHRDYESLSRLASFRESLNYEGLPLYNLVEPNLSLFFSRQYLAMLMATIEAARRMIEVETPDAIMLNGESFSPGRAIIASAKAKGIPTLLLQHGAYDQYFLYYNHIAADIGPHGEATAPFCPLPDKFAMSDGYTREVLVTHGKIPAADVLVTGTPRYDILARGDRIFNRERTLRRLNLDPDKKLLVWTTQTFRWTPSVNQRYISAVYEAVKSLKDTQLVIKLHPAERENGKLTKLYKQDKSFKPLVTGGSPAITYELLYAADILLTHWSSTAVEALTIGKPVIVMEFAGNPVPVLAEAGAALYIDKEDALLPAIRSLLYDEAARQKLGEVRERFIAEGHYQQDGQASRRVADLVTQMMLQNRKKETGAR